MRGTCILKLIGIGFIGYYLFNKFASKISDGITIDKARLKWGSITINRISITVILRYFNTNDFGIPIDGFEGQLMYGNIALSRISFPSPVTLASNVATDINIIATIFWNQLADNIVTQIQNKQLLLPKKCHVVWSCRIHLLIYPRTKIEILDIRVGDWPN